MKYLMTAKYEIEAVDDIEAREVAKLIKSSLPVVLPKQTKMETKFQKINKNQEPRRLEL